MTRFDPERHYLIARVMDANDPEHGQHVHVPLPDLAQEVREIHHVEAQPDADLLARLEALEAKANAVVPANHGALVEVPAFEEKKVAALENRLATALARIDELEARPAITGSDLEDIRRAISGRIQELIKDEVHAALSQHQAMRELRETIDRVSRETAPSQIMQTISKVSHDVANLHASTADTLQVVEAVVAETREQMHTCMAEALAAVSQEMERARDGFRADLTTRIDQAFRQSA